MPKSNDKVLPPVRANAAVGAKLRKRLETLIADMHRSVVYAIAAQYRKTPPVTMAADDINPANAMQRTMKKLGVRWIKRFDAAASDMAEYFAQSVQRHSDARLKAILRKAGLAVKFRPTKAQKDVMAATVHESAALIKSIPAKYLADVEGAVMRSVQTGRDIGQLSDELQKTYGVAKRRAAFIARSQNNIATAAMNRARQLELGIDESVWQHTAAGKEPRPSHVKAGRDKTRFKVSQGWFDPALGKYIRPGTEPNCRCVGRSVLRGFI